MKAFDFLMFLDDKVPVSIYDEAGNILYEGPLAGVPHEAFKGRDFITAQWSGEHNDMEIQVSGRYRRSK